MLDYCVIGTGIKIYRSPVIPPQGYSLGEPPQVGSLAIGERSDFSQDLRRMSEHGTLIKLASQTLPGHAAIRMIDWLWRFPEGNVVQRINLLVPFMIRSPLHLSDLLDIEIISARNTMPVLPVFPDE